MAAGGKKSVRSGAAGSAETALTKPIDHLSRAEKSRHHALSRVEAWVREIVTDPSSSATPQRQSKEKEPAPSTVNDGYAESEAPRLARAADDDLRALLLNIQANQVASYTRMEQRLSILEKMVMHLHTEQREEPQKLRESIAIMLSPISNALERRFTEIENVVHKLDNKLSNDVKEVKQVLEETKETIDAHVPDIDEAVDDIQETVNDMQETVSDNLPDIKEAVDEIRETVNDDLHEIKATLEDDLYEIKGTLNEDLHETKENVNEVHDAVYENVPHMRETVDEIQSAINEAETARERSWVKLHGVHTDVIESHTNTTRQAAALMTKLEEMKQDLRLMHHNRLPVDRIADDIVTRLAARLGSR